MVVESESLNSLERVYLIADKIDAVHSCVIQTVCIGPFRVKTCSNLKGLYNPE